VLCAALLLIALGIRAVKLKTPVDAIPDLTENQVLVYADWMGRSPQEVEDQVTFPLSTGLQGLAGVKEVRATSMFGFSLVTIIFEDRVDTYFARARVLERLEFPARPDARGRDATTRTGRHRTRLGLSVLSARRSGESLRMAATISRNSARCRIGRSATTSPACRAWRKSPASAAS
jgi:hypothetical protein